MNDAAGELAGLTQEEAGLAGARVGGGARPDREARELSPLRRPLRALPQPHRAAHLAAVVAGDGASSLRPRSPRSRTVASVSRPSASRASTSTGWRTSATGASPARSGGATASRSGTAPTATSRSPRRSRPRAPSAARPSCARTRTSSTRGSRRQLYPFATLGWPDETPELARYYPGNVLTTARDIIFLWVARHDLLRPRADGRGAVRRRASSTRRSCNPDGRRMSRTLGTGIDPEERARAVRRRRDAVRAAQDDLEPGSALLVRHDRGGAEAREQALEREPAPADGRRRRARGAAVVGRGALDPRAHRRDPGRARGRPRAPSTSRTQSSASTTSRSTTSATGTSSRSSRGSARRTCARRRSRRSSGCSSCSIP